MEEDNELNIIYIESESIPIQGKKEEIYKKYVKENKEYHIKEQGNGNGNWLLTKPSDVLVNGKSCRDFVLEYYKRSKLTKKLVEKFKKDVKKGVIRKEDIFF